MDYLFSNWETLGKIAVVGCLTYVFIVVALRISGKRTLSDLNIFDFVVTIAFGTTLASAFLDPSAKLSDTALTAMLLILLQLVVAFVSARSKGFRKLIKTEPSLLFIDGEFRDDTIQKERLNRAEVLQAVRSEGVSRLGQVEAVVLETNGNLSVLKKSDAPGPSSLKDVEV